MQNIDLTQGFKPWRDFLEAAQIGRKGKVHNIRVGIIFQNAERHRSSVAVIDGDMLNQSRHAPSRAERPKGENA